MLVDTHTHTHFSDGTGTPRDLVAAAERAGVAVLVVTDHLTLPRAMDPDHVCSVVEDDLGTLVREVREAAVGSPVNVLLGAECDYYPGCEANIARWAAPVDVRLGSVHWIGPVEGGAWIDDPDDLSVWEELGPDGVWRRYVERWCEACGSSAPFDTMAHPDLPRRFENEGLAPTMDLAPLFREMAACAHDTGRRVEVSSAAWRKGLSEPYPCPVLMDEFRHAEVPVTFGSDAHRPGDVAADLEAAHRYAHGHGYRHQEVPIAGGEWASVAL